MGDDYRIPVWARTQPTEPGYYWARGRGSAYIVLVEASTFGHKDPLNRVCWTMHNENAIHWYEVRQWAGPLSVPLDPPLVARYVDKG